MDDKIYTEAELEDPATWKEWMIGVQSRIIDDQAGRIDSLHGTIDTLEKIISTLKMHLGETMPQEGEL